MLIAHLRERFHLHLFVPLAVAIAAAVTPRDAGWPMLLGTGFALLLLMQFRVWDDLADRGRDAVTHPERVLVRAAQVTQVIAFCGALAVLNICIAVWRDSSGIAVATLAVLDIGLGCVYLVRAGSKDPAYEEGGPAYEEGGPAYEEGDPAGKYRAAGDCLLLAKYPLMLVVVAGARVAAAPLQIAVAAVALYVVVCAYESWHDPQGPIARHFSLGGSR